MRIADLQRPERDLYMQNFRSLRRMAGAAAFFVSTLGVALVPGTASALAFSDLVIFGDSLSDTGNLSIATGGAAPGISQPYYQGRFSDGLIWTDYLAQGLGQAGDAKSYMLGGNNYAYAGARTGAALVTATNPPGVLAQVAGIWGATHSIADPNALYVLVGGGNDMRDARSVVGGDSDSRFAAAQAAVNNLQTSMGYLASKGAKNFLISTLPDLGLTPEAFFLGKVAESADASGSFNSLINGLATYGTSMGLSVNILDMNGVGNQVRANPAAYGITNLNLPCQGFAGSTAFGPATGCSQSLFSDALHPSSRAHQIIANAAFATLGVTPVPEPETYAMLLAGLAMIGSVARRRARKHNA